MYMFQIIIPKLIEIINRQIHKQLSFGYDIGKGYVIGEEHISKIIDHISDDKSISKVFLNDIYSTVYNNRCWSFHNMISCLDLS